MTVLTVVWYVPFVIVIDHCWGPNPYEVQLAGVVLVAT